MKEQYCARASCLVSGERRLGGHPWRGTGGPWRRNREHQRAMSGGCGASGRGGLPATALECNGKQSEQVLWEAASRRNLTWRREKRGKRRERAVRLPPAAAGACASACGPACPLPPTPSQQQAQSRRRAELPADRAGWVIAHALIRLLLLPVYQLIDWRVPRTRPQFRGAWIAGERETSAPPHGHAHVHGHGEPVAVGQLARQAGTTAAVPYPWMPIGDSCVCSTAFSPAPAAAII